MHKHVLGVDRSHTWWLSLLLLRLSGAAAVRAERDGHGRRASRG